jgi:hypothetical protein
MQCLQQNIQTSITPYKLQKGRKGAEYTFNIEKGQVNKYIMEYNKKVLKKNQKARGTAGNYPPVCLL